MSLQMLAWFLWGFFFTIMQMCYPIALKLGTQKEDAIHAHSSLEEAKNQNKDRVTIKSQTFSGLG